MKELKKTIKWCFIIATFCICILTLIAGFILISNLNSQNTTNKLIRNAPLICNTDSVSEKNNMVFKNAEYSDTSIININKNSEAQKTEPSGILDSVVYNLTLAVNSVNNVLTSGSIFIAILTLFIGLVGLFGYHSLKTDIKEELEKTIINVDEKNKELNADINEKNKNLKIEIEKIKTTIDDCCDKSRHDIKDLTNRLDRIRQQINEDIQVKTLNFDNQISNFDIRVDQFQEALTQQSRYYDHTIDYLYQVTYSNISQMANQDEAQQLLDYLYHELQIATLYRVNLDAGEARVADFNKITALEYLEENGTRADIPHLDYIAQHDPDEQVRTRAIEVRAIIRNRYGN